MKQFIAILVEAWSETKVQKIRVIISLIGVVAAVAAMSFVIALGNVIGETVTQNGYAINGRPGTVSVSLAPKTLDSNDPGGSSSFEGSASAEPALKALKFDENGLLADPIGDIFQGVKETFKIKYATRQIRAQVNLVELEKPDSEDSEGFNPFMNPVGVRGVDSAYQVIFKNALVAGRWLRDSDANLRSNPVVIDEGTWEGALGRKPLVQYPQLHARNSDGSTVTYTVVGVTKRSGFGNLEMYLPYETFRHTIATDLQTGSLPEFYAWVGEDVMEDVAPILRDAVAAQSGDDYTVFASTGDEFLAEITAASTSIFTTVIMIIGAVVITLGSLGLLNVAVVTVRQRVREIGVRRALGASARRIFFSVFMESVVATFIAGVVGVAIAAIVFHSISLESMLIFVAEPPGFPISAALIGVAISTGVGALCGLIPAITAVRFKPIEAIRY